MMETNGWKSKKKRTGKESETPLMGIKGETTERNQRESRFRGGQRDRPRPPGRAHPAPPTQGGFKNKTRKHLIVGLRKIKVPFKFY